VPTEMTPDERRAFLGQGTRTAVLATTRADGRPHAAPIGFVLDGDDVLLTTGEDTVKGRALRHDRRVCLVVDDDSPPYAFVVIEGNAAVSQDAGQVRRIAAATFERYAGVDGGEEFADAAAGRGDLAVRVTPTHIVAQRDVATG
jgi:PPOX class probable F420-dependent enzyme